MLKLRNENRNLEDKDFVSLDGVEVVIQGEEDLRAVERLEPCQDSAGEMSYV